MARRRKVLTKEEKRQTFVRSIKELIERDKSFNYDVKDLLDILKDTIRSVLKKKYRSDKHFDIFIDEENGTIEIIRERVIVDDLDLEDPNLQISLSEALRIDPEAKIGGKIVDEIDFSFFSRQEVDRFKQSLKSRLRTLQNRKTKDKYEPLVGKIITGDIYKIDYKMKYKELRSRNKPVEKKGILVKHEKQDLFLPYDELTSADLAKLKRSKTVKAVIKGITEDFSGAPVIVLSRKDVNFIKELFRLEVPEIEEGAISIRKIVRIPGQRTKVVVESLDDRVDPVGACVGVRGSRISAIVKELNREKIDVIPYTDNTALFIQRALTPAKVKKVELIERETPQGKKDKIAIVYVPNEEEKRNAIGEKAINIRLVSRLTSYRIKVKVEGEKLELIEDVEIRDFVDDIPQEDIDKFLNAGLETAISIISLPIEEVHKRTNIEMDKLEEYYKIMKKEFEEEE